MPNEGNDDVGLAPCEPPLVAAPPDGDRGEQPFDRAGGPMAALRRKISSRLARHVALERRRLVNVAPMVSFTFDDAAARSTGWLIFCSHDVAAAPSRYGCTLGLFQRALDGAASRGLEFVTVVAGLARSRAVGRSGFPASEATGSKLS
jgi:peptidoglycan/xylan/chitin deacetylase (PgdA/CDA1 family)